MYIELSRNTPLLVQLFFINDQDDKSDIDGGSCRDFESRTTDHRSKQNVQSECSIWNLPGCIVAVFHGMLADQYICKIFGKEMEGMIYGRDIAYSKTSGQAIW